MLGDCSHIGGACFGCFHLKIWAVLDITGNKEVLYNSSLKYTLLLDWRRSMSCPTHREHLLLLEQ